MNTHQDVAPTNKHATRLHVIAVNNHKNKPTYNQTIDALPASEAAMHSQTEYQSGQTISTLSLASEQYQ